MSCVAMTCVGAVGCAGGLVALKRQGKSFSRPVVARANASGQSSGVELKGEMGRLMDGLVERGREMDRSIDWRVCKGGEVNVVDVQEKGGRIYD